ncbi:MAG TPA: hypothetical protein VIU15_22980 [Streptomyces sp.]
MVASVGAFALLAATTAETAAAQMDEGGLSSIAVADTRPEVQALTATQSLQLQAEVDDVLTSTTGGVQISANEISWNGGEPILVFPLPGEGTAPESSAAAAALEGFSLADVEEQSVDWHGCPAGSQDDNRWYCFYQHSDFKGRRLQWNWAHCSTAEWFADYGFANEASGWANTTPNKDHWGMDINVWESAGNPDYLLWHEEPWHQVAYVGNANNDKADYFHACRQ